MISIPRIRSFIAVAEVGGFRRAATLLSISQPALTGHIKAIEDDLGVQLLTRTDRRAKLTPEGEIFLARAKRALGDLQSVIQDLKDRAALQTGRIVVGCTPSIASAIIPRALAEFQDCHPDVHVEIYDDATEVTERRLLTREVDMVVGPEPESSRDIKYLHLADDPLMAVFPPGHALARYKAVPFSEFARHELITMRRGVRMREVLQAAFDKAGYVLRPGREVLNHYTLVALVEAGLGIGALPHLIVSSFNPRNLRAAQIFRPEINRRLGVTLRRGELVYPSAEKFIGVLRRVVDSSLNGQGARNRANKLCLPSKNG